MAKNVFVTAILVFLIIADVSNASFYSQIRKLIAPSPNVSPNLSPVTSGNQSDTVGAEKNANEKDKDQDKEKHNQPSPDLNAGKDNNSSVDQSTENTGPAPTPTTDAKQDKKTPKEDVKDQDKTKSDLPHQSKEICSAYDVKCQDSKSMIACVKSSVYVSKPLTLLIQNEGDSDMKVNVVTPVNQMKPIEVPKLQTKEVNITLTDYGIREIKLNARNGDCVLTLKAQTSQGNFFRQFPSYTKFMTPVYGAYFLFLVILTAGGVWACCWFGKRKGHSEIPYQELEMSKPESAAAAATAETSGGWDEVWDDDWDEEKAVTSPGARNISANGLTSRSQSKDGWENWDD